MLTLTDCLHLTDVSEAELAAIAHHEHLPPLLALEKAHTFLQTDWGAPAMRQIALDELRDAMRSGDRDRVLSAMEQLRETCCAHPGGVDRRKGA